MTRLKGKKTTWVSYALALPLIIIVGAVVFAVFIGNPDPVNDMNIIEDYNYADIDHDNVMTIEEYKNNNQP
jgi:hypothetical protein